MSKFKCACCGELTETEIDDEEALAEFDRVFGDNARSQNLVAVCDVCYEVLIAVDPLEHVRQLASEITGQDLN